MSKACCPDLRQVGQWLRLLRRPRDTKRFERIQGHDPGRNRRGESLAVERPERHIFPLLDVARAPVVHQHEAEDVPLGFGDRDRLAERIGLADDAGRLELEIELGRRAEDRLLAVGQLELALRTADRGAADDDRACPAVVGDGHVQPVRQQRVSLGRGTSIRRWWRAPSTNRSRYSRRWRRGSCSRACAHAAAGLCRAASPRRAARHGRRRSSSPIRARAAVHAARPSAMKALSVGRSKTRRRPPARHSEQAGSSSAARSSTDSPIATPARGRRAAAVQRSRRGGCAAKNASRRRRRQTSATGCPLRAIRDCR